MTPERVLQALIDKESGAVHGSLQSTEFDDISRAGRQLGIDLSPEASALFCRLGSDLAFAYRRVDELPEWHPPLKYLDRNYVRPSPAHNRLGAWLVKAGIKGATAGKLAGKRVVVKDTIAVAGLPMTDGTELLADYVPPFDATVVQRVLDAGGEIAGKAVCEFLSYSSGSHTAASGMVSNPIKSGHSSGG